MNYHLNYKDFMINYRKQFLVSYFYFLNIIVEMWQEIIKLNNISKRNKFLCEKQIDSHRGLFLFYEVQKRVFIFREEIINWK